MKLRYTWVAGLAVCLVGLNLFGNPIGGEPVDIAAKAWAKQTLKGMSLEEKIGQMFQIRAYGDYLSLTSPDLEAVHKQIRQYNIGSIDLGARMLGPNFVKGSPEQVAAITNELQRASKLPLLIGADIERGLASRLSGVPDFPFPMAFAASADPAMVEKFGAITAAEARAVGIEWAYAPVADINSNPQNPIINARSFGDDPAQVSRLVAAYIRGAHQGGRSGNIMVTVKHFPGEGDTSTDPHARATRIAADRDHLEKNEFVPFRAAIRAEADAVMLAQVSVPALDPDESKVASTSKEVVAVLRKELGFEGIVLTDALEMRGLAALYPGQTNPSGLIAVDAVKAGADVLMLPRDLDAAFTAVLGAVRSGEIPEMRIDESVRRILNAKAALGLNESRIVDLNRIRAVFSNRESYDFAQHVSDSAVTLVRSNGRVLPLASVTDSGSRKAGPDRPNSDLSLSEKKVVAITFTDSNRSVLGAAFRKEVATRNSGSRFFYYYNDQIGSDANRAVIIPALREADVVVIAAFITHAAPKQVSRGGKLVNAVGFAGAGAQLLGELLAVAPEKTVVIALGSPYLIEDFPQIQNYICTYSLVTTAEVSAAKALFGEIQNLATLPVNLPGVANHGALLPWPRGSLGIAPVQTRSH